MLFLILLFLAFTLILIISTLIARRGKTESSEVVIQENSECCGAHEVCENENLQVVNPNIEYFDDEELDELINKKSLNYTTEQIKMIEDVFYTLREEDVAGWLKSLQIRNIELPTHIKEEALLIVGERRNATI